MLPLTEYLEIFISNLELHYSNLSTKYNGLHTDTNTRLDAMHAHLHAVKYANSQNLDLNTVLDQQSQAQSTILSFNNIKSILSACIQCYLYNLALNDILPPTVINHGVVQGILAATKRYAPDIARRGRVPYDTLAVALYDEILSNTDGFATALPLPDVEPQTAETMKIKVKELTHKESVPKGEILPFDLTEPLAKVIHEMQADTVTTFTEVLSVNPDPSTLTPVSNTTLKNTACLLMGRACTPYLLDGEFVIHDENDDKYYKITPNIGNDGYASYGFRIYNHKNLTNRIYRKQNLLNTSTKYKDLYPEDLGHIKYQMLPKGDPQARLESLEILEEWDKELTTRINETFDEPDYYEAHAKAQEDYREISTISYYHPKVLFISAHKLAAYTYFPQEYSDLIIRKPLDPMTGEPIQYHVHHKRGKGSEHNNSKENLKIITKQLNDELRSTSRPVTYQGKHYNTIKSYCDRTEAGAYKKLITYLSALTPTEEVKFNGRLYTIDSETGKLMAVDDTTASVITYNGSTYATLKEFAEANKLIYTSLHNALSKARKANKSDFVFKYYRFYLDSNGNITKVIK